MSKTTLGKSVCGLTAAAAIASLAVAQPTTSQWRTVDTKSTGVLLHENTRANQLDPVLQQLFLPDADEDVKLTSTIQLFPIDPRVLGLPRPRGRARATMECFTGSGNVRSLGTRSGKINRNGGVAVSREIPENLNCEFFRVQWQIAKAFQLLAGTSIQLNSAVELVAPGANSGCFDTDSLCLNGDRFKVEVEWQDFTGRSGPGIAFPRTDDSGTFFFFDPDNTELLLKVLDGCARNGHYWVFYAATTNVEFEVTVTDTLRGETRVFDSPLGQPAPAIVDTQAFATCP